MYSATLCAKQKLIALVQTHNCIPVVTHMIYCYMSGLPRFVNKACLKRKVLSWVLISDRVSVAKFRRLAGREFQTNGATKGREFQTNGATKGREFQTDGATKGREFQTDRATKLNER